jgi:hypothetical protein
MALYKITEDGFLGLDEDSIIEIPDNEIKSLYNCYEAVYVKDDETDELVLYRNESDYLIDEDGDLVNCDVFGMHGVSDIYSSIDLFDEDGGPITNTSGCEWECDVYFYHDGHNWRGIMLNSDTIDDVPLEKVEDWDGEYEVEELQFYSRGRRECTVIGTNGKQYIYHQSLFAGSFDYFEEI